MLSEDAFESGLVKSTKNIDDSVTNSKKISSRGHFFGVFFHILNRPPKSQKKETSVFL